MYTDESQPLQAMTFARKCFSFSLISFAIRPFAEAFSQIVLLDSLSYQDLSHRIQLSPGLKIYNRMAILHCLECLQAS